MSTYLIVKSDTNYTYTAKDNIDNNNKPYINISNKYFPLTTETSGTGIKLKINNNIYKIIESYTTTINTTYKSDYTYKNTGTISFKFTVTPASMLSSTVPYILSSIMISITGHRVSRKFSFNYPISTTTKYTSRTTSSNYTITMNVSGANGRYSSSCKLAIGAPYKFTIIGTTNDSASYGSKSDSYSPIPAAFAWWATDTTASTVNSTRQGNTTTTTTSQ